MKSFKKLKIKDINMFDNLLDDFDTELTTGNDNYPDIWKLDKEKSLKNHAIYLNMYTYHLSPITKHIFDNWPLYSRQKTLVDLGGYMQIQNAIRRDVKIFLNGDDYTKTLENIISYTKIAQDYLITHTHRCKNMPENVKITYVSAERHWLLHYVTANLVVDYCPYCGTKLERLNK